MTATDQPVTLVTERVPVCPGSAVPPERGVAALLAGDVQVAVFRTYDGTLHGLDNVDPFSGAAVLCRGIVGDRGGVPVVVSPVFKQAFDLRTGRCLDDPSVSVRTYGVQESGGTVWVIGP